jgi:hypothetical protein
MRGISRYYVLRIQIQSGTDGVGIAGAIFALEAAGTLH